MDGEVVDHLDDSSHGYQLAYGLDSEVQRQAELEEVSRGHEGGQADHPEHADLRVDECYPCETYVAVLQVDG